MRPKIVPTGANGINRNPQTREAIRALFELSLQPQAIDKCNEDQNSALKGRNIFPNSVSPSEKLPIPKISSARIPSARCILNNKLKLAHMILTEYLTPQDGAYKCLAKLSEE